MKKWISLITCAAFIFSSLRADDVPPTPSVPSLPSETISPQSPAAPELADDPQAVPQDDGKKQVGQAANDGSKAAGSGAGKYVLAGTAIALGIAALILVSKNHGHHHHHHHSHAH